jgi:hypothetical protein
MTTLRRKMIQHNMQSIDTNTEHRLCGCILLLPLADPFRKDSLPEVHAYGVVLMQLSIECAFHVAVSTNRFSDMTGASELGVQLDRLEPINILY